MAEIDLELAEALQGLEQRFMSVEDLYKAGEEGTLIVERGPVHYDYKFQQMYPEHPMSESRYTRIGAADTIRRLSRERNTTFPAEVLDKLHRSLFDCCATVRLSMAEALELVGDESSIGHLQKLTEEEKESPMVLEQAHKALGVLYDKYPYTKDSVVNQVSDQLKDNVGQLYQAPLVKRWGKTLDQNKQYFTEVTAEELIKADFAAALKALPVIPRERYSVDSHDGITRRITNRGEEILAKELFANSNQPINQSLGNLGKIFDYQIPLKKERKDKAGKIDLVSFNGDSIWLVELKDAENNKDTLLSCILEIATYYQLLHKQNFINSYSILSEVQPNSIRKAVLVIKGSAQHKELEDMKDGNRLMLKSLAQALAISFFVLEGSSPNFAVNEVII